METSMLNCTHSYSKNISIDSLSKNTMPKYESSPKKITKIRNKARLATETLLKPEVYDAELDTNYYTIYRRDRNSVSGVLIAVHKNIYSTEIKTNKNTDMVWAKVILTGQ